MAPFDKEPKTATVVHQPRSQSPTHGWIQDVKASQLVSYWPKVVRLLAVEEHGNEPVPPELQTERRYLKLFTLWFSMNFSLLS